MTEKILKLLAAMGADTSQEELLTPCVRRCRTPSPGG